jgi:hypothetical protein
VRSSVDLEVEFWRRRRLTAEARSKAAELAQKKLNSLR